MPLKLLSVSSIALHKDIKKAINLALPLAIQGLQFDYLNEIKPLDLTDSGRKQLLYHLNERTLKLASVVVPFKKSLYDETFLEARVQALEQAILFASQAKAKILLFRAGRLPSDISSTPAKRLLDILNQIAEQGNQHGVLPCLIPCLDTPEALSTYIAEIKAGPLCIDFDPAITLMSNLNPLDFYNSMHRHINHITGRDALSHMDGLGEEVTLGTGEANWKLLQPILDEKLQSTWLNITRTQSDNKLQEITSALNYLRANQLF